MDNNTNTSNATGNKAPEKKKNKAVIILIILLLLALIGAGITIFLLANKKPEVIEKEPKKMGNVVIDTGATDEETQSIINELSGRYVEFAGISDATINRQSVIRLENLASNEGMLMKFIITDTKTNEVVKETDMIPAGQHIDWCPGETIEPGEYTWSFKQIPYYPVNGDYMELTTGNNLATFTIVE